MIRYICLLIVLCHFTKTEAQLLFRGQVTDLKNNVELPGVMLSIKDDNYIAQTDAKGFFELRLPSGIFQVSFSHIGYVTKTMQITLPSNGILKVKLEQNEVSLKEVIINTGYQKISKEKISGSYQVLNRESLNRRVSTDLISRLDGLVTGLLLNRKFDPSSAEHLISPRDELFSIRGTSTINSSTAPLIVVDNFPYTGNINDLNPNDIDQVTILKDAAASSIWGARAGNGVIVITTKQGKLNQPTTLSFNTSTSLSGKPILYRRKLISTSDFINNEISLFNNKFYDQVIDADNYQAVTPVVQLLYAQKNGLLEETEATRQIDALRNIDRKTDLLKYLYRVQLKQQYNLNLNGGSGKQKYYLSAGYDNNKDNNVGNEYSRFSLSFNQSHRLMKEKLRLDASIYLTNSMAKLNSLLPNDLTIRNNVQNNVDYPYLRLADDNGEPTNVNKDYRDDFLQSAKQQGLPDWGYSPLKELNQKDRSVKINTYRINTGLHYQLIPELEADAYFQYTRTSTTNSNNNHSQSYYTRDLINTYTTVGTDGKLNLNIPTGGILDYQNSSSTTLNARGQINYSKTWGNHQLNLLGGWEIQDTQADAIGDRLYGYDDDHATASLVDYVTNFPIYYNPNSRHRIIGNNILASTIDRYMSYYINMSYTFQEKYTLTSSARKDESNLFGVKTNQKGVPLWSLGLGWELTKESFFNLNAINYLKIRSSIGFSGNVNKSVSALTTALINNTASAFNKKLYSELKNPPNPDLKWERIKQFNVGLDFGLLKNRITGSLEYYTKKSYDLLAPVTIPLQAGLGYSDVLYNSASTKGLGLDLNLRVIILVGDIKWSTNLNSSYYKDEIISYNRTNYLPGYFTGGYLIGNSATNGIYPIVGKPLYPIYSYKWAGLDPLTGDPQGYLDGNVSKDYANIISKASIENNNAVFNGSARPTSYGTLINTLEYKSLSLSFSLNYRFGYYFYDPSAYTSISVYTGSPVNAEYYNRWQKPGDETSTRVPSLPLSAQTNRDAFYTSSEILVHKAENIRFQDIQLSYTFHSFNVQKLPFKNLSVYTYANNIGLLWTASKSDADPDYAYNLPQRSYSIGIKADF